jgi:hypothetical protein
MSWASKTADFSLFFSDASIASLDHWTTVFKRAKGLRTHKNYPRGSQTQSAGPRCKVDLNCLRKCNNFWPDFPARVTTTLTRKANRLLRIRMVSRRLLKLSMRTKLRKTCSFTVMSSTQWRKPSNWVSRSGRHNRIPLFPPEAPPHLLDKFLVMKTRNLARKSRFKSH